MLNKIDMLEVKNIGANTVIIVFAFHKNNMQDIINIKLKNDIITKVDKNNIEISKDEYETYNKLIDIFSEL